MLKFADKYVTTRKGRVSIPQVTSLHFQEGKKTGEDSESVISKENYHYKILQLIFPFHR